MTNTFFVKLAFSIIGKILCVNTSLDKVLKQTVYLLDTIGRHFAFWISRNDGNKNYKKTACEV